LIYNSGGAIALDCAGATDNALSRWPSGSISNPTFCGGFPPGAALFLYFFKEHIMADPSFHSPAQTSNAIGRNVEAIIKPKNRTAAERAADWIANFSGSLKFQWGG
jgi:hypothetical protein